MREKRLKELRSNEKARTIDMKNKFQRQSQALQNLRENWKEEIEERKEI